MPGPWAATGRCCGLPPHPATVDPGGGRQPGAGRLSHHRPAATSWTTAWRAARRASSPSTRCWGWSAARPTGLPRHQRRGRGPGRPLATPRPWRLRINGVTLFEVLCDGVVVGDARRVVRLQPGGRRAASRHIGGCLRDQPGGAARGGRAPGGGRSRRCAGGHQHSTTKSARSTSTASGRRCLPPGGTHGDQDRAGQWPRSRFSRATACITTSATGSCRARATRSAGVARHPQLRAHRGRDARIRRRASRCSRARPAPERRC